MAAAGVIVLAAAAVLVASVVAGGFDWSKSADELETALAETPPTQVAGLPAADGLPARGVFAQITSTGLFCLFDAPLSAPRAGGGGCNAAADPLGGAPISASIAYDGGPGIDSVRDARLIGLAAASVAEVRVLMSDGSWRPVKLRQSVVGEDLHVFAYRVRKSDLKKEAGPTAVVAFDVDGTEVGRQTTGFG